MSIQKVQLVRGRHETVTNLMVLGITCVVAYYSFYPQKAEQHVEFIREKLNTIHTRFAIWQGMNATLHDIWMLRETPEPRITDVTRNAERPS